VGNVQIRFESLDGIDPDQIRTAVETITGESPSGSDPDAWLSELADWVDENSVLVKRTIRGVSREFGEGASLSELESAIEPALGGGELDTGDFSTDDIEAQAERFARARDLFQQDDEGSTLWERFSERTAEMKRLYIGSDVTGRMQSKVGGNEVPDATELRELLDSARAHRRQTVEAQYKRITGEVPPDDDPEQIVSSLVTWLYAQDGSTKETADRVSVEFSGVTIDDLYELFETAWDGAEFSETELVDPTVFQQAKRYADVRRLIESTDGGQSLWSQLREALKGLEEEYPNHPTTQQIEETLAQSQPPSVEEVEKLLDEAEDPFEIEERLADLAEELQGEYPEHETTAAVKAAVEGGDLPDEERAGDLIDEAEELLSGGDNEIQRIREMMDRLDDGAVILVESADHNLN
jgi:hypothetical protein